MKTLLKDINTLIEQYEKQNNITVKDFNKSRLEQLVSDIVTHPDYIIAGR